MEGWRSLLARTDPSDAACDVLVLLGFPFAKLTRRRWPHPRFNTKYNALSAAAYFSIRSPGFFRLQQAGDHKPMQVHWLLGSWSYNAAGSGISASCGLHPSSRARDSGFRRRVGTTAQHESWVVNKVSGRSHRKMSR